MKKILSLSISKTIAIIGLLALLINSTAPLMAQEPQNQSKRAWSNVKSYSSKAATGLSKKQKQALVALKLYSGKANRKIKKITNCLQGKDTCTKAEIRQARIYAGIIAAAITIILATGTGIAAWKTDLFGWGKREPDHNDTSLQEPSDSDSEPPLKDPDNDDDIPFESPLIKQIEIVNMLNKNAEAAINWNDPVEISGNPHIKNKGLLIAEQFELLPDAVKKSLENWYVKYYNSFDDEAKQMLQGTAVKDLIKKEVNEKEQEQIRKEKEKEIEKQRIEQEEQERIEKERIRIEEEAKRERIEQERLKKEEISRAEIEQLTEKTQGELVFTDLHNAIRDNDQATLQTLLQQKTELLEIPDKTLGDTPLHLAVKRQKLNLIPLLLNAGAALNTKNKKSETPLEIAAREGNPKIFKQLAQAAREQNIDQSIIDDAAKKAKASSKLRELIQKYRSHRIKATDAQITLNLQRATEPDLQKQQDLQDKSNLITKFIQDAINAAEAGDYEASINALKKALR